MNWAFFQTNFLSFARLAKFQLRGADLRLARQLARSHRPTSTVGASQEMLALLLLWRIACWPRSLTLVLTPMLHQAMPLMAAARNLVLAGDPPLREHLLFSPKSFGIRTAEQSLFAGIHSAPGAAGVQGRADRPLTFLVPDLDLLCGPHILDLATSDADLVVANLPLRGNLSR